MTAHPSLYELDRPIATGRYCYLYGIATAAEAVLVTPMTGVLGAVVEPVLERRLVAFVSELAEADATRIRDELTSEDEARAKQALAPLVDAHARVVDGIFGATTVIPLRFGSLLTSRAQVSEVLRDDYRTLATVLCQVSGCAEWDLLVTWDTSAVLQELAASNEAALPPDTRDDATEGSGGRAYLEAKRCDRDRRRAMYETRARVAEQLHHRVRTRAAVSHVHNGSTLATARPGRRLVLHATYLVARDERDAFEQGIEHELNELAMYDLRGQLAGPFPPYSFAELRIGERL